MPGSMRRLLAHGLLDDMNQLLIKRAVICLGLSHKLFMKLWRNPDYECYLLAFLLRGLFIFMFHRSYMIALL